MMPEDAGISGPLLLSLYETLKTLREFESNESLKVVFDDERIASWADGLPEARDKVERVRGTVNYLKKTVRIDNGQRQNLLILFLEVLQGLYKPTDAHHVRIGELVEQLSPILQPGGAISKSRGEANPEHAPMWYTAELHKLVECTRAVGKVKVPQIIGGKVTERIPSGTGWFIAPGLVVTCWHVVKARSPLDGRPRDGDLKQQIVNSVVAFDYLLPGEGIEYRVQALECIDPALDYVLLRIQDRQDHPFAQYGYLKIEEEAPLTQQTQLYILQHPRGQPQQQSSGRFMKYQGDRSDRILHTAPTGQGTSGAPVLNTSNWRVIALHTGENEDEKLREAIPLRLIIQDIQRKQPTCYREIRDAQ